MGLILNTEMENSFCLRQNWLAQKRRVGEQKFSFPFGVRTFCLRYSREDWETVIDNLAFVGNQSIDGLLSLDKNIVIEMNKRLAKRYAKKK